MMERPKQTGVRRAVAERERWQADMKQAKRETRPRRAYTQAAFTPGYEVSPSLLSSSRELLRGDFSRRD